MTIYKEIESILKSGQSLSIDDILSRLPDLASRSEAREILRLLLRLNIHFKPLSDEHWVLSAVEQSPEQRIVAATQAYFETQSVPGLLIGGLVRAIAGETGYPEKQVRAVILENFENNQGRMVFNKLKENS